MTSLSQAQRLTTWYKCAPKFVEEQFKNSGGFPGGVISEISGGNHTFPAVFSIIPNTSRQVEKTSTICRGSILIQEHLQLLKDTLGSMCALGEMIDTGWVHQNSFAAELDHGRDKYDLSACTI